VAIDRVAECDTARRVPERHGVQKHVGVGIRELQGPVRSAVDRFVDTRRFTGADAEHVRDGLTHRVDIAEVELLGTGHRS
jgi:hypothetical protein